MLVELDTAKLRDQILRSRAALAAAQAKVAQTGATVQEARATLGRLEEVARLSGGKVPSKTELDGGRATLARALADDGQRARRRRRRAGRAVDRRDQPVQGVDPRADRRRGADAQRRPRQRGGGVAAGGDAVHRGRGPDASCACGSTSTRPTSARSRSARTPRFTVSAYPSRSFPARITRVAFGSTITDNVVTYLTYLDVDNADLSLRPGMTATATITATAAQRRAAGAQHRAALHAHAPRRAAAAAKRRHRVQPDAAHARQRHAPLGRRRRQHRGAPSRSGCCATARRWRWR